MMWAHFGDANTLAISKVSIAVKRRAPQKAYWNSSLRWKSLCPKRNVVGHPNGWAKNYAANILPNLGLRAKFVLKKASWFRPKQKVGNSEMTNYFGRVRLEIPKLLQSGTSRSWITNMSLKCNPQKRQSSVSGCPVQSNFQSFSDGGLVILESTLANKMNSSLFFTEIIPFFVYINDWVRSIKNTWLLVRIGIIHLQMIHLKKTKLLPPIFTVQKTWDHLCYQTLELHATLNGLHEIVTCNRKSCIAHRTRTRIEIEHQQLTRPRICLQI